MSDLVFNHSQVRIWPIGFGSWHFIRHQKHDALLKSCTLLLTNSTHCPPAVLLVFFTHHRPHLATRDLEFFEKAKVGWITEKVVEKVYQVHQLFYSTHQQAMKWPNNIANVWGWSRRWEDEGYSLWLEAYQDYFIAWLLSDNVKLDSIRMMLPWVNNCHETRLGKLRELSLPRNLWHRIKPFKDWAKDL